MGSIAANEGTSFIPVALATKPQNSFGFVWCFSALSIPATDLLCDLL